MVRCTANWIISEWPVTLGHNRQERPRIRSEESKRKLCRNDPCEMPT